MSVTTDPVRVEALRIWLRDRVERDLRRQSELEGEAGLPEGWVAGFLAGGAPRGLTAAAVARLARALQVDEAELLVRTGHVAAEPCPVALDEAILSRPDLDRGAKLLLVALAARLTAPERAGTPPRFYSGADRTAARGEAIRRLADERRRRRAAARGRDAGETGG